MRGKDKGMRRTIRKGRSQKVMAQADEDMFALEDLQHLGRELAAKLMTDLETRLSRLKHAGRL